ncbi:MAG: MFS transporter [Bacillota bacterium]|nr:MFS transporter [Bacillota bacterium]
MRQWPWSTWSKPFIYVVLCALFLQFGLGMQRTLFNNFAAEEFGAGAQQIGWLESVREIPGLLTFLIVGLTVLLARNLMLAVSVCLVGAGLMMYAGAGQMGGLVIATLVYSTGFHVFFPLQSAQVLGMTDPGHKAKRLGELNSVAALSYLLAMGFVYLAAQWLNFRQMFIIAGAITLPGALIMLALPRTVQKQRPRGFVIRRAYSLYYALTFLASTRRQIVTSFAIFALVKVYGAPVRTIAALLFVSNVLAVLTRSLCGQMVDRIGERNAMWITYASVIFIFLGYAFIPWPPVLYGLYILDNFLMGFDVSQSTYLDKIATRDDVPPTLALGSTINHITGVTVPLISGYLWASFGHWASFVFGAVVAGCSLYLVSLMRVPATPYASAPAVVAGGGSV